METIQGVPITDGMIQVWADQAERGYDVEQLRKRGRKPIADGPARLAREVHRRAGRSSRG